SKGLVELHGGKIEASSAGLGRGSTFVVRLPLAQGRAESTPSTPRTAETPRAAGRRILIADDNRDAATTLAMLLEDAGHHVEVVHDGRQALEALAKSAFDIAVLDIGMPNVNGYEVARRVRADGHSITLVALTGWGKSSDREEALDAGFDQHWVKPIEPDKALGF